MDLLRPSPWVDAVNDSSEETELRRNVLAVSANVFFADASIEVEKGFHAERFAEEIGCVTQLGRFHHHTVGGLKYKFCTEKVLSPSAACKLPVEEGVVVQPPSDLSNVEVSRYAHPSQDSLQLPLRNCLGVDPCPDRCEG